MAVLFDAASVTTGSGTGPFTWAHTCTGSDRALDVNISIYDSADFPTSVTYNGVALTLIGSTSNGQYTVYQYYLIAPATGANNIEVAVSGNVFDFVGSGVSLTGVDQTTAIGTQAVNSGTDTTPTVNVTSAANEYVIDALIITHGGTLTVDGSQTQQAQAIGGAGFVKGASSTEGGAATTTMSWGNSSSQAWAIVGTPFKPVSGAATGQPYSKRVAGVPWMRPTRFSGVW